MKRELLLSLSALAVALTAIPLTAQDGASLPVNPDDPEWAHPPIVILPSPDTTTVMGYSPIEIRSAYGLAGITNKGAGQTIALVDAFDNPDAVSDLTTFDEQFKLAACTEANGCFKKIYATGTKPSTNTMWASEISLDIEWSHAIAPEANILLVEAASASRDDLLSAVVAALQNGATVVSMSWSGKETANETENDYIFNVEGVVFCSSSGDNGHGAYYPAASSYVVAVGGTTLEISGNAWSSETAWADSGGGKSKYETEPSYQASSQTSGKRGIPDVAWDANPNTGVAVYSKTGTGGWAIAGGTSVGSPSWAGIFAIVNSRRAGAGKKLLTQPQILLYPDAEADYHDITSGSNASCGTVCTAGPGYDFVTGLGSPQANLLIPALFAAS
jgi:subtilase family serine protease